MEEILEQFPQEARLDTPGFHSFVYQAERIALSSYDDINRFNQTAVTQRRLQPCENFYTFRVRLPNPLLRVKGIQLLSAIIPNPNASIPEEETTFLYYRIPAYSLTVTSWIGNNAYAQWSSIIYSGIVYVASVPIQSLTPPPSDSRWIVIGPLATVGNDPNYYKLYGTSAIQYVYLQNLSKYDTPRYGDLLGCNKIFQDYQDLVTTLNVACVNFASIPGDISFELDPVVNRIRLVPNPANIAAGYFYLPCGFNDPNVVTFVNANNPFQLGTAQNPYALLNQRLGFTWNGVIDYPEGTQEFNESIWDYVIPHPPTFTTESLLFNAPPNLCNTSSVHIYSDIPLGSSQDSAGSSGLLSIVPMNAFQYGICYYQNNFDRPLTKIPDVISEIYIEMRTDKNQPYWLPYSANVVLELSIKY